VKIGHSVQKLKGDTCTQTAWCSQTTDITHITNSMEQSP